MRDGQIGSSQGDGRWAAALALGAAVFAASLVGIYTRPENFLASVWPANAVMLGLLVRHPRTASPPGWAAAAVAFLAADLLTGASLLKALLLNSANLAGVGAAYLVYRRQPRELAGLQHPTAMLYLVAASAAGAMGAGLVGAVVHPLLFGASAWLGWALWFSTDFVNYVTR